MKTALITGTASGIGRMATAAFLGDGWRVIATLRNADERRHIFSDDLEEHGDRLILHELDVCSVSQRQGAVELVERVGRLDCLINNAGYGIFGAFENLDEDQLRKAMETLFFAPALLTRALLPKLRDASGCVLNVSSVLGRDGFPLNSAYCASKFALEGLSEALHYELASHGVRVGLVEPGGHRTGFAASAEWARGDEPAYRAQTESFQRVFRRLSSGEGKSPDAVARALLRLANAKRVPLRTRLGADAAAMTALDRLLPARLRTRVYRALYGRMLSWRPL